ncbi:hypothetical protein GBAR_LOCUS3123, partial [Geodia barretti]
MQILNVSSNDKVQVTSSDLLSIQLCVLVSLTLSVSVAEVNSARVEFGRPGKKDTPFP